MKSFSFFPFLFTFCLAALSFKATAQDKNQKILESIETLINDIDLAIDTIYSMDQIDKILVAGRHPQLNNYIEYYRDSGGDAQKCDSLQDVSNSLEVRLKTRREGIDTGNFNNLKLKETVEAEILSIQQKLASATKKGMSSIDYSYKRLRSKFDINMEDNTMMDDWKKNTIVRLDQLKNELDTLKKKFGIVD